MIGSKILLAAALVVATSVTGVAYSQAALKIGVINVGRLLEQSPQSASVSKKLQDEFGPRQRDIEAMAQKLKTRQETFTRDAPVMSEEERLNLERQIRDGQRDLERTQNEYIEDLNVRRNEEVGKLQREVLQKVQEYARTHQYDLVLADAIFVSTAVDITEAVLAALKPASAAP